MRLGNPGRRSDQITIDTIAGATYSLTPTDVQGALIATDTSGFTYEKLLAAHKFLRGAFRVIYG